MHLDFSQVGGSIENLEEKFNFYLGVQLNGFIRDYLDFYSEKVQKQVEDAKDAGGKLAIIQSEARSKGYPLYLIIDEYDNFTNTVLNEQGEDVYWAITHAEAPRVEALRQGTTLHKIIMQFESWELKRMEEV